MLFGDRSTFRQRFFIGSPGAESASGLVKCKKRMLRKPKADWMIDWVATESVAGRTRFSSLSSWPGCTSGPAGKTKRTFTQTQTHKERDKTHVRNKRALQSATKCEDVQWYDKRLQDGFIPTSQFKQTNEQITTGAFELMWMRANKRQASI